MKVEVVNYPRNWSSLFSGKKFICAPNEYDVRTFWNQIMWADTLKVSTSSYDGSDKVVHHDIIQVLHSVRKYHFNCACICVTKMPTTTHSFSVFYDIPLFNTKGLKIPLRGVMNI